MQKYINFKTALAPLAGVTDKAFRKICKRYGADIMTTEMVSAKGIYYKDKKTTLLLDFDESEQPIGIQIFGSEPDIMAYAAKKVEELKPAFIDINMGCPMPKIINNGDGSALMKDLKKAEKVITAVVKSVKIPVTVKFRAGYDANNINAVELAKICEVSGVSAVTVHGRTREQLYSGNADWDIISEVKSAVKIFVYGNGDIFKPQDAINMQKQTGCDGVAVARGALGNPFIFTQIKALISGEQYPVWSDKQKLDTAIEQIRMMCEYKPEHIAISEARKHIAWYLKGMYGSTNCKTKIFSAKTLDDIIYVIDEYLQTRRKEEIFNADKNG